MNTIKSELWEMFPQMKNAELLKLFWFDFQRLAKKHRSTRLPSSIAHPPGYGKRFENLRAALCAMKPEDLHLIDLMVWGDDKSVALCATSDTMRRVKKVCEHLSVERLNPRCRKKADDFSMGDAAALWVTYIKKPITTSETGPFARFARLFFRQIDPAFTEEKNNLQRRIRNIRFKKSFRQFPSLYSLIDLYGTRRTK